MNKIKFVKKAGYKIGLSYKVKRGRLVPESVKYGRDCESKDLKGVVYIRLLPSKPHVCLYVGKTDNSFKSRMTNHMNGTFKPTRKSYKKVKRYRKYVEGKEVQIWIREIPKIKTPFGPGCPTVAEEQAAAKKLEPKFSKKFGIGN